MGLKHGLFYTFGYVIVLPGIGWVYWFYTYVCPPLPVIPRMTLWATYDPAPKAIPVINAPPKVLVIPGLLEVVGPVVGVFMGRELVNELRVGPEVNLEPLELLERERDPLGIIL